MYYIKGSICLFSSSPSSLRHAIVSSCHKSVVQSQHPALLFSGLHGRVYRAVTLQHPYLCTLGCSTFSKLIPSFRHSLMPSSPRSGTERRRGEAVGMVSATQPVLGMGTALEIPLCRAAHGDTTHQSIYCCWSPSMKCNSWEREHRGKAPVSHAGTPPPTGKSALSACEETPAAPLLLTFREARSLCCSQSSWRRKPSWHAGLAALERLRGQQPSCHTACESPSACDKPHHSQGMGRLQPQAQPPCGDQSPLHPQRQCSPPGHPRSQDGRVSGRHHISAAPTIPVPTLLQPDCLIIRQKLIFPQNFELAAK